MPTIHSKTTILQKAVAATGDGNIASLDNMTTAVFNVTGTFSATINFEVSNDSTNWVSLSVTSEGTNAGSTTATVAGLYRANVSGYKWIRARVTWTSGTSVTVDVTVSFNTVTSASGGGATGASANQIQGNIASSATDSGNPVKVGGVYNTTLPTLTNGQRGDMQMDYKGVQYIDEYTKSAGEDLTNDVLKVEQRFSYYNITTNTTVTIKSGSGFIHGFTINNPGKFTIADLVIAVYDNTAGSGTLLGTWTIPVSATAQLLPPQTINCSFTTGLTFVVSGPTVAANITVMYR